VTLQQDPGNNQWTATFPDVPIEDYLLLIEPGRSLK